MKLEGDGWWDGGEGGLRGGGSSPLLSRAVGLSALAAADGDGVKVLEGSQGHPGDGEERRAEGDENRLGVVELLAEVMEDWDDQGIVPAAQAMDPCQKGRQEQGGSG